MKNVNFNQETQQSISPGDLKVTMNIGGMLYEIGHLFSYDLRESVETAPAMAFGEKFAVAKIKGKRSFEGTLVFEVVNQSLVHELKEILFKTSNPVVKNGGFSSKINSGTFIDTDFEKELGDMVTINDDTTNINAMDLPPFDIIFTAQDPHNPKLYSQKRIEGVTIFSQSSAIGVDTIKTQDAYGFMCRHVTPLTSFESDTENLNDAVNGMLTEENGGNFVSGFILD